MGTLMTYRDNTRPIDGSLGRRDGADDHALDGENARPDQAGITLGMLSDYLSRQGFDNTLEGLPQRRVTAINTLQNANASDLSFLTNSKYRNKLVATQAAAVILDRETPLPRQLAGIRCDDPHGAVTTAIIRLHGYRQHPRWGIDPHAVIDATAQIGAGANIGSYSVIDADAVLGERVTVYPHCYVGAGVTIGEDTVLYPNVTVYDRTWIGARVTVHAGTVIGQDGLGYAPVDGRWLKIPQIGCVMINDDVEIGANCAIDRATLGETVIGRGSKFSDLVVIGHGTTLGEHCMIVAQVGIAGSVTVGDQVTLGGQAGVSGHLTIGDGATVGAKSGVWSSIEPGAHVLGGEPAQPTFSHRRQLVSARRLPDLVKRLRALEIEVERLNRQWADDE